MNSVTISTKAMEIIEKYGQFSIGNAKCTIPYFNNKNQGKRGALKVEVGKGSIDDIHEELMDIIRLEKIDINSIDSNNLKKILIDNNIGIDCSGFAYYILNEESISRKGVELGKNIHFINAKNIFTKIKARFHIEKNTDVLTLADDKNSELIGLIDIKPADIITMLNSSDDGERNHIVIVYKIDYENNIPKIIYYTHAIAWPMDGEYGHGIHFGEIRVLDTNRDIIEQEWFENEKIGEENYTHSKAKKSKTEIRRLISLK